MSASRPIAPSSRVVPAWPVADPLGLLRDGELEIVGRLLDASNATFVAEVRLPCPEPEPDMRATVVYKPIRGERPLEDFPIGTLANREVAAHVTSEAIGWSVVPPTVLRDGPHGTGAVQLWVDVDDSVHPLELLRERAPALRRMALFDAAVNNADRKVGHLLPVKGGHVFGVDHGICFAVEPKLRTVLWVWRGERVTADELATLQELAAKLDGGLGSSLSELLSRREILAMRRRVKELIGAGRFPDPIPGQPAIPWPPY
jgi:uncharacterized repeat protein (TIGR03843 family)